MKLIKLLLFSCLAVQSGFCQEADLVVDNLPELEGEASDKALKKLQAQNDSEEALSLLKTYFDNACSRVFNVRLAKEAEYRKVRCDDELARASNLSKITTLRRTAVKMQSIKNLTISTHDNVLVKEKQIKVKLLGTNPLYKANKSKFDNLFASLEALVKTTSDALVTKNEQLVANPKAKQTEFLASTHSIIATFLSEVKKLRTKAKAIIKPA